jgi:hypothetical protein
MNFNFIPTDNFHKFLAISGLFILILSIYYPTEEIFKISEEEVRIIRQQDQTLAILKRSTKQHEASLKSIHEVNDAYRKSIDQLHQEEALLKEFDLKPTRKAAIRILALDDSVKITRALIDSLENIRKIVEIDEALLEKQVDSATSLVDYNHDLLELKEHKYDYYQKVLFYSSLVAAFLISFGFVGWYEYQQKLNESLFRSTPQQKRLYWKRRLAKKSKSKSLSR